MGVPSRRSSRALAMNQERQRRWLLRVLGLWAMAVPAHRRDAWMREWSGELCYALGRTDGAFSLARVWLRAGLASVDALWIRMEDVQMGDWLTSLARTARTLMRSPTFTVVFVMTLAVGIGASTTVFSVANWALLRPLPGVESPDDLISIRANQIEREGMIPFSYPMARRIVEETGPGLTAAAAYVSTTAEVAVVPGETPLRAEAQAVTTGYFDVLGVPAFLGRLFEPEEGDPTSVHRVMVLSHDYWSERFGADPAVVGRTVDVNGSAYAVVGIAAPEFVGTQRAAATDIWFPISAVPEVLPRIPPNVLALERAFIIPELIGRLTPGAAPEDVGGALGPRLPEFEAMDARLDVASGLGLSPGLQARVSGTLWVLGGLVSLLLALTVANLTNLILSRLARRRNEALLRKALGASFGRLTLGLMAETGILALLGSTVALIGTWLVLRALEGAQWFPWFPAIQDVPLDGRVLAFSLASAAIAALTATSGTAWAFQRLAPADAMRSGSGSTRAGGFLRKGLVSVQVAISLCILISAGLLVRSLDQLHRVDLGMDPSGVVLFSLNPGSQGYSTEASDRLFRDLHVELTSMPSIEAVGFSWLPPFGTRSYTEQIAALGGVGEGEIITAQANMITPDYLQTLGLRLLEGRTYDEREYLEPVRPDRGDIVLNRTLAETLFPGESALGREVRLPGRSESAFEVIGVIEDARLTGVREPAGPLFFDPFGNGYTTSSATFALRTSGDAEAMLDIVRRQVRALHPDLALFDVQTFEARIEGTLVEERMMARVTSIFALLSVLLASVGLYGLVSESAQARVGEFGIRTALGAGQSQVLSLVLRESLVLVLLGSVLGLLGATQIARLLEARLFEVGTLDPTTFLLAPALMVAVALVAAVGPAVRALRVDPARTLQAD